MKRRLIVAAVLALHSVASAEAYRVVGPDGAVEFTDRPVEGAESIPLPDIQTYTAPPLRPAREGSREPQPARSEAAPYERLLITSPSDQATLRGPNAPLSVTLAVVPELKQAHRYVLALDGVAAVRGTEPTLSLDPPERGMHRLGAWVEDARGKRLIESPPVTIYVHRPSKLFRSNP